MSAEVWRPIPGCNGDYDASDQGRIRTWRRPGTTARRSAPVLMTQNPDSHGYATVTIAMDGVAGSRLVHHLVLRAFVGPRPDGLETRHLDSDNTNNKLSNLVYGTRSQNTLDQVAAGTHNMARKTHCPQNHPYDEANTERRDGRRHCRQCSRDRVRAYRARRKTLAA